MTLNGIGREVIGVMPASFAFPSPATELWEPEKIDAEQAQTVGGFNYQSIARLTAGMSVASVKRVSMPTPSRPGAKWCSM